jgi:hypothetical protein
LKNKKYFQLYPLVSFPFWKAQHMVLENKVGRRPQLLGKLKMTSIFENGRRPYFFKSGRRPQYFSEFEDDLNLLGKWKIT